MERTIVAIDGPAASGKSTAAKRVAAALGMLYVDSGAVYRGVTFEALRRGVDVRDSQALVAAMRAMDFRFFVRDGAVRFSVGGFEPVAELRTAAINENVSPVAANPQVREQVTAWLRDMAGHGDLVMEGRDIGTAVFPATPLKFYLDASSDERARRRHAEMAASATAVSVDAVGQSIARRDRIDSGRQTAPLRVGEGAVVVDTTSMAAPEVADFVLAEVRRRLQR